MPVFEFVLPNLAGTSVLQVDGPVLQVQVRLTDGDKAAKVAQGETIPPTLFGYAMVDTGASISGIHQDVLVSLGIEAEDTVKILTPGGVVETFTYEAQIDLPTLNIGSLYLSRVTGSQLNWQTTDGKRIIMIIGRDILTDFLLVYNGKTNTFTLAY